MHVKSPSHYTLVPHSVSKLSAAGSEVLGFILGEPNVRAFGIERKKFRGSCRAHSLPAEVIGDGGGLGCMYSGPQPNTLKHECRQLQASRISPLQKRCERQNLKVLGLKYAGPWILNPQTPKTPENFPVF